MPNIRKAELGDVPAIFELVRHYAAERVMLPRPLQEIYEDVWEFTVAEEDGQAVGCAALKLYSAELAEIRSLCVLPGGSGRGVGGALLESLLDEAEGLRLKTLFALTLVPGFFQKLGFREVARDTLPMKVWRDCLQCEKYFSCDEKTLVLDLAARSEVAAISAANHSAVAV
ncbi:MAG: N-acetyltransferase [Acidobacteria bacterium]|nr:N-acetyltransferase [Acidobacteriota bacterium]